MTCSHDRSNPDYTPSVSQFGIQTIKKHRKDIKKKREKIKSTNAIHIKPQNVFSCQLDAITSHCLKNDRALLPRKVDGGG